MSSPNVQTPPPAPATTKEAQERIRVAASATQTAQPQTPSSSPQTPPGLTGEALEAEIRRILGIKFKEDAATRQAAMKPMEPNWALLTEEEATDLRQDLSIPIIEHEVPSYMDMRLKDPEYITVWANRDQRRMGELLAQGYEPLKEEHVEKGFKVPLKFDSDGFYTYMDVIAMRVHKKILFAKRRSIVEKSHHQLRALRGLSEEKLKNKMDNEDPLLGNAFRSGRMGFYSTTNEE